MSTSKGLLLRLGSAAAHSLFATFFPADCRLCAAPLANIARLPVCEDCLSAVTPIQGGLCHTCGERLSIAHAAALPGSTPLCELCRRARPRFVRAAAYGSYEGPLQGLIQLLKYQQVRPAADFLGTLLAKAFSSLSPNLGPVLVVPVPLHRGKKWERGFNQSELIARAALKLHPLKDFELRCDLLHRRRATTSQTGLTRHQRRENVRGAFVAMNAGKMAGREVLLLDDVFTTGTTVSECARVLLRAGASKVWVATVARTLKIGSQPSAMSIRADGPAEVGGPNANCQALSA